MRLTKFSAALLMIIVTATFGLDPGFQPIEVGQASHGPAVFVDGNPLCPLLALDPVIVNMTNNGHKPNGDPNVRFEPENVVVEVGRVIRWQNTAPIDTAHTTTDYSEPPKWASGLLVPPPEPPTGHFEVAFCAAGTYAYYCNYLTHEAWGMIGNVTVV